MIAGGKLRGRAYPDCVDVDRLFLETMNDLDRRLDAPVDEYDVLMIAPLLRKLLLDDSPLVHLVNRQRRVKFRFRYATNGYREAAAALGPVLCGETPMGGPKLDEPRPCHRRRLARGRRRPGRT